MTRQSLNCFAIYWGDEGYHVVCCFSGKEAYAAIERHKPKLAILDMQMEKQITGLEVLQMMRSCIELRTIPVIIYSADNLILNEMKERLLQHGCMILAKPFRLDMLLDMIERSIVLREREV
jgi:CheY-like chemotaxis protein